LYCHHALRFNASILMQHFGFDSAPQLLSAHHRWCSSSRWGGSLQLHRHGHRRRLQHTCSPHCSHSYSCHTCSSGRRRNGKGRAVWGHVTGLETGLGTVHRKQWDSPLCKSQGWSLSDRRQTLPQAHSALNTSAGRISLSVTKQDQHQTFWRTQNVSKEWKESDKPFSRLRLQGFSKLLLTSRQPACVFQLLTKPAAVASGTPLSFRKSSAWLLLKLPHRPAGRNNMIRTPTGHSTMSIQLSCSFKLKQTDTWYIQMPCPTLEQHLCHLS